MHLQIDGIRIEYEIQGEGIPVLLLHGFGGSMQSMRPLADYLIHRGNKVIIIDFPGFGRSDPPPKAWSVTEYAQCLKKIILQLDIAPCDIVAHSFGARITIILSAQYPELVDHIIMTGAAGLIPKRGFSYYFRVYRYKVGKHLKKIHWINQLLKLEQRQKKAGSSEYQELTGTMRPTYVKVVNQNLHPYLHKIKSSTLLIWGQQDTATPLWMGKIMEKEIPDVGLVVFEDATHFAYLEQLPRFCKLMDVFLRR